jgi:hypothetical protein
MRALTIHRAKLKKHFEPEKQGLSCCHHQRFGIARPRSRSATACAVGDLIFHNSRSKLRNSGCSHGDIVTQVTIFFADR